MTKTEHARGGWFRFSLRSLFLTILVVASFFAGRVSMIPSIQQMHAEAEMQRAMAHKQRAVVASSFTLLVIVSGTENVKKPAELAKNRSINKCPICS